MKENDIESYWSKQSGRYASPKPPRPTLIACGKEVSAVRKTNAVKQNLTASPIVLARLEPAVGNLHKPLVSLYFYTMIQVIEGNLETSNDIPSLTLTFELKRDCDGNKETLKVYQFIRSISLEGIEYDLRDSFHFLFCDRLSCCSECCVYTVELSGIEVSGINNATVQELISPFAPLGLPINVYAYRFLKQLRR